MSVLIMILASYSLVLFKELISLKFFPFLKFLETSRFDPRPGILKDNKSFFFCDKTRLAMAECFPQEGRQYSIYSIYIPFHILSAQLARMTTSKFSHVIFQHLAASQFVFPRLENGAD